MAGKIQNEDVKSLSELQAAGGSISQLINDSKIYISAGNSGKTLFDFILDGDGATAMPLQVYTARPANSRLYVRGSFRTASDGAKSVSLTRALTTVSIPDIWVDFQTGQVSNSSYVEFTLPSSTLNYYRRCLVSLTNNGKIRFTFSNEVASAANLPAPETLFANDALPLAYLDLQCDHASGKYRSAGASSSIITPVVGNNSTIFRFAGAGGVGGGGSAGGGSGATAASIYYAKSITLANNDSITIEHKYGTATSLLKFLFRISNNILNAQEVQSNFNITQIDLDNTQITNISGESKTFDVLIFPSKFMISETELDPTRTYTIAALRVGIGNNAGLDTSSSGTLYIGNSNASSVYIAKSGVITYIQGDLNVATKVVTGTGSSNGLDTSSSGALYIGNSNASSVYIAKSGVTTYIQGDATISGALKFGSIHSDNRYISSWITSSSTTTLAHGLGDAEKIKNIILIEKNTSTNRYRVLDGSSVVLEYDNTNLYLDWSGYTPSSTLQYQIVTLP